MYKKTIIAICCMSIVVSVSGCAQNTKKEDAQKEERPQIVTSFFPLSYIVKRIGGERVNVINLSGATNIHEYELSPHDVVALHDADSVFILGGGLELWADELIGELRSRNVSVIAIAEEIDMHELSHDLHNGDDAAGHVGDNENDAHNEEHADEANDDAHDHAHADLDPHIWIDPIIMKEIGEVVVDHMSTVDPSSADLYRVNANHLYGELDQLDRAYGDGLSSCARESAIVSHDAFGYLERRYEFTLHAIAGISTLDEPSAKILAQIKDIAYTENVTHVLIENNAVDRFAQMIASETGLRTLPIDPISQHTLEDGADYFAIAYHNLDTLREALGCE